MRNPLRVLRVLRVHRTGSRGGAKARRYVHFSVKGRRCVLSVRIRRLFFSTRGRGRPRPIQVHRCACLRRAYQQRLLQVRAPPARRRDARVPRRRVVRLCCPALHAQAPQGLPGAQRGLQPAVSACGRGRPRSKAQGVWARRLRSQEARGSIVLPGARRPSPAGASRRSARASARSLPLARAGGLRLAWPRALARRHEAYTG